MIEKLKMVKDDAEIEFTVEVKKRSVYIIVLAAMLMAGWTLTKGDRDESKTDGSS